VQINLVAYGVSLDVAVHIECWRFHVEEKLLSLTDCTNDLRVKLLRSEASRKELMGTILILEEGGKDMRDAVMNASVQAERWDSKEKRFKNHIANLEEALAKLKLQNANARRENTESVSSLQSKLKEAKDHAHQIVRKYNDALISGLKDELARRGCLCNTCQPRGVSRLPPSPALLYYQAK
jgi:chromosome segregation ATPase